MAASKKPKPGSAESKKAFYTAQRVKAEKTGDKKTSDKINQKLYQTKFGPTIAHRLEGLGGTGMSPAAKGNKGMDAPAKKSKKSIGGHRGS
jgi:hypothetical protein